ncbi:uncharacterized protein LOC116348132 isoform X2 [Contarinia nasturtii]|uniref:uncharacterized protein LOC116348132 isoform X2 n=1 Tax=Contarinia nasturtii TaxID=265458 RepID=UPI0012D40281|nr:uncharacterized protein LOC116348132 isoform X2 [Contarinia nasturtii]
MAAKQSIIIASVLLLVIFVGQGVTIKCFECNSNVDIRCALAYPPSEFVVDCADVSTHTNLTYNYCRKISQVVRIGINSLEPDSRVLRECGSDITEVRPECYTRHGISAHQQICECDISYCNGFKSVHTPCGILLVVLLILTISKSFTAYN